MATYTASAVVTGGRAGHATTLDPAAEFNISAPAALGGTEDGYNPEQLFAVGWGACYQSALMAAAKEKRVNAMTIMKSQVRVNVTLTHEDTADLSAKIEVYIPDMELDQVQELVDLANTICPYSKATEGNIPVETVAVAQLD
ncbi:Ohr family peroxiredoxin [Alloscardovia omnicolens]|uniref:Ohr family peroxiredoxin n=1 Tax=Alloscardovia omnicolens TaxID=419015 RepID=UPI003A63304D